MNKPTRPDVRINVPLIAELHAALRVRAFNEGVTLAELVERLLCEANGIAVPNRDQGRKGGIVYPSGGTRALVLADGQR